jgi:hypothetical protein
MDNPKVGNSPTETEWADVPQKEIERELAYWQKRRAKAVWLVPCRYTDGKPTCSGSQQMPYSNAKRRLYVLESRWTQR